MDNSNQPIATMEDVEESLRQRRERRGIREREQFLAGNKALWSEIARKADVASRERKMARYGYGADDVNQEVSSEVLDRITQGETFQDIVDSLVKDRVPVIEDTSDKLAHSLAISRLCAAAAMRLIRKVEKERPVGDATAVMGEEVQMEQKELSEDERARGNDRQMTAVLSRKAKFRGIHRAEVYGVADSSFRSMKDNYTRMVQERTIEVHTALFDAFWTPETEVQQLAWMVAFGGDSVADVLFGAIPNIDASEAIRASAFMRTFGLNAAPLTHLPEGDESDNSDVDPDLVQNTYPVRYPYKPLTLSVIRTKRPSRITHDHRLVCGYCRSFAVNNPFVVQARKNHEKAEKVKQAADPAYVPKPYKMPEMRKNCAPGKVLMWRGLDRGILLPESASKATLEALRRALLNFRRMVLKGTQRYWLDEGAQMQLRAQIRTMLEDRHGCGQGVRSEVIPPRMVQDRPFHPYTSMWPEEVASGKEARRFAIPTYDALGNPMGNLVDLHISESFTIDLAMPVSDLPDYGHTPYLPGTERTNNLLLDMRDGWIKVSNYGNADHEGVTGTFVVGLPGLIEWTRARNNAQKFIRTLIRLMGR